jgi:hypothetical protein
LDSSCQASGGLSDASGKISDRRATRVESAVENPSLRKLLTTMLRRSSNIKDIVGSNLLEQTLSSLHSASSVQESRRVGGLEASNSECSSKFDNRTSEAGHLSTPPWVGSLDRTWSFFNAASSGSIRGRQKDAHGENAGSRSKDRACEAGALALLNMRSGPSPPRSGEVLLQEREGDSLVKLPLMPEVEGSLLRPGSTRPRREGGAADLSRVKPSAAAESKPGPVASGRMGGNAAAAPEPAQASAEDARAVPLSSGVVSCIAQTSAEDVRNVGPPATRAEESRAVAGPGPVAEGAHRRSDGYDASAEQTMQKGSLAASLSTSPSPASVLLDSTGSGGMRPKHVAFRHMHEKQSGGSVDESLLSAGAFAGRDDQSPLPNRSYQPWASTGPSAQQATVRSIPDILGSSHFFQLPTNGPWSRLLLRSLSRAVVRRHEVWVCECDWGN